MIANADVKFAWTPSPEQLASANVTRLAQALGCDGYADLHRVSIEEPDRFWRAVAADLELELARPWDRVLDDSRGIEWTTWFDGARLNVADACLHAWAKRTPDAIAAVFRTEDGLRDEWTFASLSDQATRLAEALAALGVGAGDRVAIYMPMAPEAAVASHACAHIGAVQVPIFSGFAAPAVVQRLQDSGAKAVLTADYSLRRGSRVPMRETIEEALRESPSVEHVVEWSRSDRTWSVELGPGELPPLEVEAEHPYLLAYTSGTTGRPKGALHVHGGFLLSIAREAAYQADIRAGDRVLFATDMGWIMGPWTVVGAGALGAAVIYMEGAPDRPDDRLWTLVEEERVTMLGVSPTLIRALIPKGVPECRPLLAAVDHDDRRALERGPVRLAQRARRGRRPDPDRQHLRRHRGRRLLPLGRAHRPDEAGLARVPGARPGDGRLLAGGQAAPGRGRRARLHARLAGDDARRLGRRRALPRHLLAPLPRRLDARRLGVGRRGRLLVPARPLRRHAQHRRQADRAGRARVGGARPPVGRRGRGDRRSARGEGRDGLDLRRAEARRQEDADGIKAAVAAALGKAFSPERVLFVSALPKTRSAKIVRRAVRATALGEDPGDLSTLENPETLEEIANAV